MQTTCPPLTNLKQKNKHKKHPTTNCQVPGVDSFNNVNIVSFSLIPSGPKKKKNHSVRLSSLDQVHTELANSGLQVNTQKIVFLIHKLTSY